MIARRASFLTAYQDAAYAKRYTDFVAKVRAAETQKLPGQTALTEAVARYYFKLLAIKDEYEVARLYTDGEFAKRVAAQFEGDYKLTFHLAPPLSNKPDPVTGEAKKSDYGPWMMSAFSVLARMKGLRGTAFDIFGRTAERRMERQLITDYEALIDELLPRLAAHNHAIAVELASIPEHIRGYGHVKERHLKAAKAKEAELVAAFRAAKPAAEARAGDRRRGCEVPARIDLARELRGSEHAATPSISPARSRWSRARIAVSVSRSHTASREPARKWS